MLKNILRFFGKDELIEKKILNSNKNMKKSKKNLDDIIATLNGDQTWFLKIEKEIQTNVQ